MIARMSGVALVPPIDVWACGAYTVEMRKKDGITILSISGGKLPMPYHAVIRGDPRAEAWRLVNQIQYGVVPREGVYRKPEIPMVLGTKGTIRPRLTLRSAVLSTGCDLLPPPVPNRASHPFVGKLLVHGIPILVENAKGSLRSGVDKDGTPWSVRMGAHYGEIEGTQSTDGDAVDVYVGDDLDARMVYIVHQKVPGTDAYDEPKCLIGFPSAGAAERFYRSQYDRPGFFGGMDAMPVPEFWAAVSSGAFTKLGGDGRLDRAHHRVVLGLAVRKSVPRAWLTPSPFAPSPLPGEGKIPRLVVSRSR